MPFFIELLFLGGILILVIIILRKKTDTSSLMEMERERGKYTELFLQNIQLQEKYKTLEKERENFQEQVLKFTLQKEQEQQEVKQGMARLENAQQSFIQERERLQEEEKIRQQEEKNTRNKIWSLHESRMIFFLKELCKKPSLQLSYYDNTSLPEDFDGSLKPDFLVEFLGQYIVFDAKHSTAPATYFTDQVRKTAKKYTGKSYIFPTIFFVVPIDQLQSLSKVHFCEEEFTFFLVSIEMLEPLLANYKLVTTYTTINTFDPQDRESMVRLVAEFERHLSFRNAVEFVLSQESRVLFDLKNTFPEEMQTDIHSKKTQLRPIRLKESAIRAAE